MDCMGKFIDATSMQHKTLLAVAHMQLKYWKTSTSMHSTSTIGKHTRATYEALIKQT